MDIKAVAAHFKELMHYLPEAGPTDKELMNHHLVVVSQAMLRYVCQITPGELDTKYFWWAVMNPDKSKIDELRNEGIILHGGVQEGEYTCMIQEQGQQRSYRMRFDYPHPLPVPYPPNHTLH